MTKNIELTRTQKVRCKRLQEIFEKKKGQLWKTQAEFAAKLNIGASALSQYLSKAKPIKSDKARLFESALKLKALYLDNPKISLYLLSTIGDMKKAELLKDKINTLNKKWHLTHNVLPITRADFILGDSDVHFTAELHDIDEIPELIAQINEQGLTNTKTLLVIKEPIIFKDVE